MRRVAGWQDKLPMLTSEEGGYLLKQGGSKGGARSWKRRYCVLQGGELLYYKEESHKGVAPVRGATIDACMPRSSTSATSAGLASATGLWPPYFILDKGNMKQLLSYVAFLN